MQSTICPKVRISHSTWWGGVYEGIYRMENKKGGSSFQLLFLEENQDPRVPE